jgi:hypothetical protein
MAHGTISARAAVRPHPAHWSADGSLRALHDTGQTWSNSFERERSLNGLSDVSDNYGRVFAT